MCIILCAADIFQLAIVVIFPANALMRMLTVGELEIYTIGIAAIEIGIVSCLSSRFRIGGAEGRCY